MRTLVSCRLDGAISQFEVALVTAHLRRCPDCAAFESEIGAFTELLRTARPVRVPRRITLPRAPYRRPMRVARGAVATAAVAMAAVAIGGSGRIAESAHIVAAPPNDAVRISAPAVAVPRLISLQELYREPLSKGLIPVLPLSDDDRLGEIKPVLPAGNV
ncbi:MAG TPA: zf-HC2 domain-containing protein [Gaiellaceae bacterium]|nr:zf-HC2 domain-containing protein [Gaiellaceae bacterium]